MALSDPSKPAPPAEMAALFNQIYDQVVADGLDPNEAHDRAHAAVLEKLEARERYETMKRDQEMTARYQTPGSPHGGWERARDWGD